MIDVTPSDGAPLLASFDCARFAHSAQDDTGAELATIAAALAAGMSSAGATTAAVSAPAAWTLSMRRPDLEFDDLLALGRACSTKF